MDGDVDRRRLEGPRRAARRAILRLVRDQPRSVTEIAEHFDITQQAVSLHLKCCARPGWSAFAASGSSTVEITLTPIPSGTRVTVEHRGLPPDEAAQHAIGWPHFLGRLRTAGRGDDPGRDPFAAAAPGNARPEN
jgi:DNA-binding transcriptional ArsR family regulator